MFWTTVEHQNGHEMSVRFQMDKRCPYNGFQTDNNISLGLQTDIHLLSLWNPLYGYGYTLESQMDICCLFGTWRTSVIYIIRNLVKLKFFLCTYTTLYYRTSISYLSYRFGLLWMLLRYSRKMDYAFHYSFGA